MAAQIESPCGCMRIFDKGMPTWYTRIEGAAPCLDPMHEPRPGKEFHTPKFHKEVLDVQKEQGYWGGW